MFSRFWIKNEERKSLEMKPISFFFSSLLPPPWPGFHHFDESAQHNLVEKQAATSTSTSLRLWRLQVRFGRGRIVSAGIASSPFGQGLPCTSGAALPWQAYEARWDLDLLVGGAAERLAQLRACRGGQNTLSAPERTKYLGDDWALASLCWGATRGVSAARQEEKLKDGCAAYGLALNGSLILHACRYR